MRYVVIGSSAAGINGIRGIRQLDKEGNITLISKDKTIYSRCILHHYMENIRTLEQLNFSEPNFMELHNVQHIKGKAVKKVVIETKEVILEDNTKIPYDKLLVASGASSFYPPVPGLREAKGVFGFRNIDDIENILEEVKTVEDIVVMGSGLVGMDCISGLLHSGKNLSLVEMQSNLLPLQLDSVAATAYEKELSNHGVTMHFQSMVTSVEVDDNGRVKQLICKDGKTIPCQLLVVSAGVNANIDFLQDTGITLNRGLCIDEKGVSSNKDIYGAGDVTGQSPIWPVAVKEGIIAGNNMAGGNRKMNDFFASKSTMNFFGIATLSLGVANPSDDCYEVTIEQDENNYRKIIHKDGKIYGAILQGDLSYAGVLTQLIRRKLDVSKIRKPLFKIDYSDFFHTTEDFEFKYK